MNPTNLLRIDASMRVAESKSRQLTDQVVQRLLSVHPGLQVTTRDLRDAPSVVTEQWIGSAFSPPDERNEEQKLALEESDALVREIQEADLVVLGTPIYNFGVPAALKAWIDQIVRAGVTFRYGDNGPVGLLADKKAIVVLASGGTEANSEIDFATPYLKHILGFVGIHDVSLVLSDQLMTDAEATTERAHAAIAELI